MILRKIPFNSFLNSFDAEDRFSSHISRFSAHASFNLFCMPMGRNLAELKQKADN